MNEYLTKLYEFTTHLTKLLEEELATLQSKNCEKEPTNKLINKQNIINAFSKIVNVILQLKKLDKENVIGQNNTLSEEDRKIIERFIERYNKKN